MGRIITIPLINLLKWAKGNEYTIEDESVLSGELAESDKKTDQLANVYFKTSTSKGKRKRMEGVEVSKNELKNITPSSEKDSKENENQKDEERTK